MKRLVMVVMLPLFLGCSLHRAELQLEKSRLELELASLKSLHQGLSGTFPPNRNDVEFVLRWDAVNSVLAGADSVVVPVPGIKNAYLHVNSIRVQGQHGAPLLDVATSVSKGGATLEVKLLALLVVDDSATTGPVFRVRVQKLAPVFSWRHFRFNRLILAERLLTVAADKFALNKIVFPVPLSLDYQLAIPSFDQTTRYPTPRGNGSWVDVRVRRPGAQIGGKVHWTPIFLRDGLHLYATVE